MNRNEMDILIVDDEYQVRRFWSKILQARGFGVATAQDGIEALQMLGESRFDICILDLVMPKMNGMDVLEKLKKRGIDVKVVILTAHGSIPSAVEAMQKGADGYIQKPSSDIDEALSIIDDVAKRCFDVFPSESASDEPELPLGLRIKQFIQKRFRETMSLDRLSVEFGVTKSYISIAFKRDTGVLYSHFLWDLRMEEARKLLRETDLGVGKIAKQIGLTDTSYFTRAFTREEGTSPTLYRKRFR